MSTKTSMNLKVRWIFSGTSLINPWGFKDRFLDDFGLVDLRLGFSIFFGLENLADGRFFEVSDKVFLRWAVGLDLDIALFLFMALAGFLLAMAGFFWPWVARFGRVEIFQKAKLKGDRRGRLTQASVVEVPTLQLLPHYCLQAWARTCPN